MGQQKGGGGLVGGGNQPAGCVAKPSLYERLSDEVVVSRATTSVNALATAVPISEFLGWATRPRRSPLRPGRQSVAEEVSVEYPQLVPASRGWLFVGLPPAARGGALIGTHEQMMRSALEEARQALHLGEIPIGAVVAADQEIIAVGFNQPVHSVDPSAHAEIVALRKAAKRVGNYRLSGLTLYVTVEPCMMCVGAILHARIGTLVYGAAEPKFGAVETVLNLEEIRVPHRMAVISGVLEHDCRKLMQDFFKYRRENI